MKKFEVFQIAKMWHRHTKSASVLGGNGASRLAWCSAVKLLKSATKKMWHLPGAVKWSAVKWGLPVYIDKKVI